MRYRDMSPDDKAFSCFIIAIIIVFIIFLLLVFIIQPAFDRNPDVINERNKKELKNKIELIELEQKLKNLEKENQK